jgi:hypothetical protein
MTDPIAPFIQRAMIVDSTGVQSEGVNKVAMYFWDTVGLTWTKATTGGAVGTNVNVLNFPATTAVTGTFWQATQPVSGTFWQTTQPVSAASLPLPTGAATETTLAALNTKAATETTLAALNTKVHMGTDGGIWINQNITVDAASSSVANLASGASFTGPWVNDLNYTAVQYILKTDQPCQVHIQQSPDGTFADVDDVYDFYGGIGSGNTVQLVGSFYRFIVTNTGPITTTYFRLQVIQIPFLPSLPRSLDIDGNLSVGVYGGIHDKSGFHSSNTPHSEQITVPTYRLIGGTFDHPVLDPNYWTAAVGTGGSATVGSGNLTIATGAALANNAVSVVSVKIARYVGGSSNNVHFLVRLPDGNTAANNTRRGGVYNATDGVFFELANTVLKVVTRIGGVDTPVLNGAFNGKYGTTITLTANMAHFDIRYTADEIWFYLNDEVLHHSTFPTAGWTAALSLPLLFENFNTGGSTTNVQLVVRQASVSKEGWPSTQARGMFVQGLNAGTVGKYGAGNLHGISISGVSNNSVVTLYDNTAASGVVIWTTGAMGSNAVPFDIPMNGLAFSIGITVAITGAAANALVKYE